MLFISSMHTICTHSKCTCIECDREETPRNSKQTAKNTLTLWLPIMCIGKFWLCCQSIRKYGKWVLHYRNGVGDESRRAHSLSIHRDATTQRFVRLGLKWKLFEEIVDVDASITSGLYVCRRNIYVISRRLETNNFCLLHATYVHFNCVEGYPERNMIQFFVRFSCGFRTWGKKHNNNATSWMHALASARLCIRMCVVECKKQSHSVNSHLISFIHINIRLRCCGGAIQCI